MKHVYDHIDPYNDSLHTDDFFRDLKIPYGKNREEAWVSIESKLSERPLTGTVIFTPRRMMYGIAATLILLAAIFSLLKFYTTSVYCPAGKHLSYHLPDGSSVQLNAESHFTYKPYWWRFSREVHFEGEGFFSVEKGKKFSVISAGGRTEVLGTSFNIYSRESEYKVTCITGKVRVVSFASAEVILGPEYTARVNASGEIIMTKEADSGESHSWINNMFSFTSRPLALVFNEIGRQYDVRITLKTPVDFLYTGYFSKNRTVEETLSLVCTPFGLTFARISENEFEILQN
jgi:transmembrane sensor